MENPEEDHRQALRDSARRMRENMENASQNAKDAAYHAGESMRHFFVSRSQDIQDAANDYSDKVRSNPFQSTLLAFSVGFLVASLLRRR